MKAFLISPGDNLIERIITYLFKEGKDYSSNLVVFPGKRPSHFLRKRLAEIEGSSFLPPRIFSMDEFIDYVYSEVVGIRRRLEIIDAIAILYEIHKDSRDPFGNKDFLDPDTFFPIGVKIYNDIEELCIEGVSLNRLKEFDSLIEETMPPKSMRRLQSLSYFYENFYKKIEDSHYSTRSSRYRDVSLYIERFDFRVFNRIIFSGFFGLTKSERLMFNYLKEREETIFFFQDGFGIDLSSLGIIVEKEESYPSKPQIHFYKSPDTHGQVFGVGTILKEKILMGEKIDERTVVVLPLAETLFPLFHHALNLLSPGQYNISLGYPLERTPLWALIKTLMELVLSMDGDRLYVPYYLNFVLHPYIKNIYFEGQAETTRILFQTIEEVLSDKKALKFITLKEIEEDEILETFLRERILGKGENISVLRLKEHLRSIHENTIQKVLYFDNVGEFARRIIEFIQFIFENSVARLHPFFYPYCETFIAELDKISRSLMRNFKFKTIGSYFNLIKQVIISSYTPFYGTPLKGLQVLGFLETRNIKFERIFFLDLNEGVVPEIRKEDTLLPFKVRKILGIPTHLDREKLIGYYFDILIKGACEVHLFYIENKEKDRSRFIERLLWEIQKKEKKLDEKEYLKWIQYPITLKSQKPRDIEKSPEIVTFLRNFIFSASCIDHYLSCPLRFYYEHILELKEKETVSEDLEREEIGNLVHEVLFEFFKDKIGESLSEKDMNLEDLSKLVFKHFEKRFGKSTTGELYLLRRQVNGHLKDFIKDYQIPKIKSIPTKIIGLERRISTKIGSFHLIARLDRIEKRAERTTIIDYKTSANKKFLSINFRKLNPDKRESWTEAIPTLQLPFYLTVYSQFTGDDPQQMDGFFLLLGRNIIDTSIEVPLYSEDLERRDQFLILNRIIFSLLNEIIEPSIPFSASLRRRESCLYCIYQHICTN